MSQRGGVWVGVGVMLAVHWGPLAVAAWRWPLTPTWSVGSVVTVVVAAISCLLVLASLPFITNVEGRGRHMSGAWEYLIYAMVTFGVVPAIVIAAHVTAGRLVGWIVRLWI